MSGSLKNQLLQRGQQGGEAPPRAQATPSTGSAPDPNALLAGGITSLSFPNKGEVRGGTILSLETVQSRDYDTGAKQFWGLVGGKPRPVTEPLDEQGNPREPVWQVVVTLQTDERDDEDDDGKRRWFLNPDQRRAVMESVKEAGQKGVKVGGSLFGAWVDDKPAANPRHNPRKIYAAEYTPPGEPEMVLDVDEPSLGDAE